MKGQDGWKYNNIPEKRVSRGKRQGVGGMGGGKWGGSVAREKEEAK